MTAEEIKTAVADAATAIVAAIPADKDPSSYFADFDSLQARRDKLRLKVVAALGPDAEYAALAAATEQLASTADVVKLVIDKALSIAQPMILAML